MSIYTPEYYRPDTLFSLSYEYDPQRIRPYEVDLRQFTQRREIEAQVRHRFIAGLPLDLVTSFLTVISTYSSRPYEWRSYSHQVAPILEALNQHVSAASCETSTFGRFTPDRETQLVIFEQPQLQR
jgi:hypothetical protein